MSLRMPFATLFLLCLCGASGLAEAPSAAPVPGQAAFEWAFKFASAIEKDPKDQSMAQELAVLDMGYYASLDAAVKLAERIEGWHRGVALAELAKMKARRGKPEEARSLIKRAEEVRKTISGWQNPRIAAHIAQAQALLGNREGAEKAAEALGTHDRQYFGRPAATSAAALAEQGDFEGALAKLKPLEADPDEDVAWWRTAGYIDVARAAKTAPGQRTTAFDLARRSAERIPGWRRAEALINVANACKELGDREALRAALEPAEAIVLEQSDQGLTIKGPMLAELARFRAWIGDRENAARLLEAAERAGGAAMKTEQPSIFADLAHAWHAAGDREKSAFYYDKAFTLAEGLVNARPRALAAVEIARSLGRAKVELDQAAIQRLQKLFGGLKDPW